MAEVLDIEDIRSLLPHRYPMLLVDRVLEIQPGEHIKAIKNVTINEPFFDGHFPGKAVMPGVLILESMAQVAGLMMMALPRNRGKLAYIGSIEEARFRRPVVPGDTLEIEAWVTKARGPIGKVRLVARVNGALTAECAMTFALKGRVAEHTIDEALSSQMETSQGGDDGDHA